MSPGELPAELHLSAWLRLERTNLRTDAQKFEELRSEFIEHRWRKEDDVEFDALLLRVRRVFVNVAFEVLVVDILHDPVSFACSSLGPPLLIGADKAHMIQGIRHVFELFGEHGPLLNKIDYSVDLSDCYGRSVKRVLLWISVTLWKCYTVYILKEMMMASDY